MIKNISNLGDAAVYCDFGSEINKEITPNGLLLYVVEDRIKGDYSNVSEEDRLEIIEESKRTNLQSVFNELRAKYNFDEKISVSNQFANQNL